MTIHADRTELLTLRARIVALEQMAAAALELALRIRPEELSQAVEFARLRLSTDYQDHSFADDITSGEERLFLAAHVEKLMRNLQYDLGFQGGISAGPNG